MARNRSCPRWWRAHDLTLPCQIEAPPGSLRLAIGQRAAESAENAAIRRYLDLVLEDPE